ncbi:HTH-type transcriptional regulator VirS [Methyloligella halotolerans]|uniref:HTH-type transcriptional regulator VirS n=1 Tax=Methyloligella halotolerans TaxID=1177755 RepID=A0A1E2RWY6_9HYPH|nr:AraC family transcriptional regulator [Methyloligella halotolerans]ODA66635.1 HTH-type transcriptional regulator VirS [Methyloligella halotolerans]
MRSYALTKASTVGPIAEIVAASGGSIADVFRKSELPLTLLDQPQRLILLRDQFRLLETAARTIGDHGLAVRLSTEAGVPGLGAYGAHLVTLPTLGDAIGESSRSLASLLQGATTISLTVTGPWARWTYSVTENLGLGQQKNEMLAIGYMLALLRYFAGNSFTPDRVEIAGRFDGRRQIEDVVASDVTSGETAGVVFPAELLALPNPRPASGPEPDYPAVPAETELTEVVRHIFLLQLDQGESGIDHVAARLGLSRRTLQRRLREQAVSFESLAETTLRDQARALLKDRDMPITEIALSLGYSDPAHFTRAFRRWTGETPLAWRRRLPQ